ncbi:hypothetical protein GGR88_002403 [Sphingomonas jejuensis]|uniref:Uncharacterized protein n=1 Tax=Sphingomonas jejuensis TaxID=904715 RepID=A0ABX0XNE0_9SPHN|nr:hypothetical protein [Sphingomonas jejuensis]NJC34889.1 hypothetical protein [Sphingomonas jejuensis]
MRLRSIILAAAVLSATPTMLLAQSAEGAEPAPAGAVGGTADGAAACPLQSNQAPPSAPRRRRGLGGLLRAVGSSGALAFVPGLGMAGQVANLAAGTAAQLSAEDQQGAAAAEQARQSGDAVRLAACQAQAAAAVAN